MIEEMKMSPLDAIAGMLGANISKQINIRYRIYCMYRDDTTARCKFQILSPYEKVQGISRFTFSQKMIDMVEFATLSLLSPGANILLAQFYVRHR